VIVTHKHAYDEDILQDVIRIKPALPYIGMIGSTLKVKKTRENLTKKGINLGDNLYSPIGLDLGGGSPADIAISITSELLGIRHKKNNLPHCRNKILKK
jgi:xanthine dehydrogenase accessory factor